MANEPAAASLPANPSHSQDTGLGVPPFRPAPPKDPMAGRPPFAGATANPPMPASAPRPAGPPVARSGPLREVAAERRILIVSKGVSVQGSIQDAERLVIEGLVECQMVHASELSVSPGGVFRGEAEVEDAEVAGTVDGTLLARGNLVVRATGVVLGTARCRRLQVEDGGQITGRMEMITEAKTQAQPVARQASEA